MLALPMVVTPAGAAYHQSQFAIISAFDPPMGAQNPYDVDSTTADSLRLEHFKSLGFNMLGGGQAESGEGVHSTDPNRAFDLTKTMASRLRLCTNVGLKTIFDYTYYTDRNPAADCDYCTHRPVPIPTHFPECDNEFGLGPIPPAEHCGAYCQFRTGRDLPSTVRSALEGYFLFNEPGKSGNRSQDTVEVEQAKTRVQAVHANHPNALGLVYTSPQCPSAGNVYEDHLDRLWLDADPTKRPDVVSVDEYPILGKNGETVSTCHFYNLKQNRDRAGDRPFWIFLHVVGYYSVPGGGADTLWIRDPTQGDLNFSTFTGLAYGVKGVSYFTYSLPKSDTGCCGEFWNDAIISSQDDFSETAKKAMIRTMNHHLATVDGPLVMGAKYIASLHESTDPTTEPVATGCSLSDHGSGLVADLPGTGCMVGVFRDSSDTTTAYLMVVNKDHVNSVSGNVVLRSNVHSNISSAPSITGYSSGMSWTGVSASYNSTGDTTTFAVSLDAGEGRWFKVTGVSSSLITSSGSSAPDLVQAVPAFRAHLAINPSPFRGQTTIFLSNPKTQSVRLAIYNVRGQLVRELSRGRQVAGEQAFAWNGTSDSGARVGAGVYFCRAETEHGGTTARVVLVGRQ